MTKVESIMRANIPPPRYRNERQRGESQPSETGFDAAEEVASTRVAEMGVLVTNLSGYSQRRRSHSQRTPKVKSQSQSQGH